MGQTAQWRAKGEGGAARSLMKFSAIPWFELTLALPLLGALVVAFFKTASEALRASLCFFVAALLAAAAASFQHGAGALKHFAVDDLAAPMLPVLAMLHLLTLLGTAKSRVSPKFCVRLLLAAFVSLAAVTCHTPWMLVTLLVIGVLVPLWDLLSRGQVVRGYLIHMGLFVVLLVVGLQFAGSDAGYGLLLIAWLAAVALPRCGVWHRDGFCAAADGSARCAAPAAALHTRMDAECSERALPAHCRVWRRHGHRSK